MSKSSSRLIESLKPEGGMGVGVGVVGPFPSSSSSDNPTRFLTPSPSTWRHYFYVLKIYRFVLLCLLFGCMSSILGVALFMVAILFRSNTTSVHLLESVPLYMPGFIIFCNGISMLAFMNKNTRRFNLLKSVCGLYLLVALLMIIVAISTTSIHLPRLNSHRECAYNIRIRACTCVMSTLKQSSQPQFSNQQQQYQNPSRIGSSKHFTMEEIMNCDLVHGILLDSLRVVFTLSLLAIIISIFSMLTLYQLYAHEKQKNSRIFNQVMINHHHYNHPHLLQYQFNLIGNQSQSITPTSPLGTEESRGVVPVKDAGVSRSESETQNLNNSGNNNNNNNFIKCLSAVDFSSSCQDLLVEQQQQLKNSVHSTKNQNLDNESTFPVETHRRRPPKIWSSQSTTSFIETNSVKALHNHENDHASEPLSSNLRRYMSVLIDHTANINNLQSFLSKKLRSITQTGSNKMKSDQNDGSRSEPATYALPPPHVFIPRNLISMGQKPQLSSIINDNNFMLKSSTSSSSSYSSTSYESSLTTKNNPVKQYGFEQNNDTANNQEPPLMTTHDEDDDDSDSESEPTISFGPNAELFNVEQARTDFTSKYCQSEPQPESLNFQQPVNECENIENEQEKFNYNNNHNQEHEWPISNFDFGQPFECIDEDYDEGYYPQIYDNGLMVNNKPKPNTNEEYLYFNPFEPIMNMKKTSDHVDVSEVKSQLQQNPTSLVDFSFSGGFTNGNTSCDNPSNHIKRQCTTFEEAFKNYYDSQNRISNSSNKNYYTLPTSTNTAPKDNNNRSGHRSGHRKHHAHHHHRSMSNNNDQVAIDIVDHQIYPISFPAIHQIIEPPKDYQNVALNPSNTNDEFQLVIGPKSNEKHNLNSTDQIRNPASSMIPEPSSPMMMDQLLLQPYHYLLEQLDRSNRQSDQPTMTAKSDTVENGFIEDDDDDDDEDDEVDDGAGDTSTSQDIADFELELDEEPIKFIGEEDYNPDKNGNGNPLDLKVNRNANHSILKNEDQNNNFDNNTVISKLPNHQVTNFKQITTIKDLENAPKLQQSIKSNMENKKPINLLGLDMQELLKQQQQLLQPTHSQPITKIRTNDDFGFDGFRRKSETLEEEESPASSSSSLTNDTTEDDQDQEQSTDEEDSITTEYIKPPTPFTNYLV